MNDIFELLLMNFTTVCLIIGLGIITTTNKSLDKRTNSSFKLFISIVLALVIADSVDFYLSMMTEPSNLRHIAAAVGYTLRPASLAILIDIMLRRKKTGTILWIPIVIVGVLAFTSNLTHVMFWFDEVNFFRRGPLGYLSHIISGLYLVLLVFLTLKMQRNISSAEIFILIYSAVICVIATVLESVLSDCKFLLTGAMASSCTLYYTVLYVESYQRDPLTGLMNRRSFYLHAKGMRNRSVAVISIDLNSLKEINDSFGHSAGDKALQDLGDTMLAKSGKKFLSYRVGGDEFMALGKGQTAESVNAYINSMRAALEANNLMASFGYAFYKPGDDFDNVCNQADAHMYDDKKRYKHRVSSRDDDNKDGTV